MVSEPNKTICGLSLGSTAVPANMKQSSQKKFFKASIVTLQVILNLGCTSK